MNKQQIKEKIKEALLESSKPHLIDYEVGLIMELSEEKQLEFLARVQPQEEPTELKRVLEVIQLDYELSDEEYENMIKE